MHRYSGFPENEDITVKKQVLRLPCIILEDSLQNPATMKRDDLVDMTKFNLAEVARRHGMGVDRSAAKP